MNVVVICCDTFRYDHLGFLGLKEVQTPNLDRLARESACFTDYFACSFPTLPNRIETFSGRCAFPVHDWGPQPFEYPVFAEVFRHHGYATALLADNPHLLKKNFGFDRGFDWVRKVPGQNGDHFMPETAPMAPLPCPADRTDPRPRVLERYRRNAEHYRSRGTSQTEELFKDAMGWLDRERDKFLLWIDCFNPHEPWDAPACFRDLYPLNPEGDKLFWPRSGRADQYSAADLENMRSLYKAAVTQADYWTGRLLEHLANKGFLENTAVIFCSDHGYYLGEHELVGKLRLGRPTPLYEEVGRVPLMIRHPAGHGAGQQLNGMSQPPDLFPTLLELAGIPAVGWTQGHSLVPRLHGEPGERQYAVSGGHPSENHPGCLTVWTQEWCFVYSPIDGVSGSELYRRNTADGPAVNVINANPGEAQAHFSLLLEWLAPMNVSPARKRQLLDGANPRWCDRILDSLRRLREHFLYRRRWRRYKRSGFALPGALPLPIARPVPVTAP